MWPLFLPPGRTMLSYSGIVRDTGQPDPVTPSAQQIAVQDLPDQCILYLLPSRYCETDRLMHLAWSLFKDTPLGWPRVQAICDYVHNHLTFGYQFAAPTKSAHDVHDERRGVCRDFAHLAVTLCRCMNIPARSARAILATSACRRKKRQWTTARGSRPISPALGTRSTRATTCRGSGGFSSDVDATLLTCLCPPASAKPR